MMRSPLILAALLGLSAPALAQPRPLPQGEISANGEITFGNALKLGKREGNRTVTTPDTLQILGSGSTGDASLLSVTPNTGAAANTLGSYLSGGSPLSSLQVSGANQILMTPYANNLLTYTSLAIKGLATHGKPRDFQLFQSLKCVAGAGVDPADGNQGCVVAFADVTASPGASQVWAGNQNVNIESGFLGAGGNGVHGHEINMNNYDGNVGDHDGDPYGKRPSFNGLSITSLGGPNHYRITGGINLSTDGQKQFNRGFYVSAGSVTQCTFCDYNSGAATVLDIRGSHAIGIDSSKMTGGPVLRLSSASSVVATNGANTGDYQVLSTDSNNRINLGSGSNGIVYFANVIPSSANSVGLGAAGLPFSQIVASSYVAGSAQGVSCNGAPTSQFQVTNGIVTRC